MVEANRALALAAALGLALLLIRDRRDGAVGARAPSPPPPWCSRRGRWCSCSARTPPKQFLGGRLTSRSSTSTPRRRSPCSRSGRCWRSPSSAARRSGPVRRWRASSSPAASSCSPSRAVRRSPAIGSVALVLAVVPGRQRRALRGRRRVRRRAGGERAPARRAGGHQRRGRGSCSLLAGGGGRGLGRGRRGRARLRAASALRPRVTRGASSPRALLAAVVGVVKAGAIADRGQHPVRRLRPPRRRPGRRADRFAPAHGRGQPVRLLAVAVDAWKDHPVPRRRRGQLRRAVLPRSAPTTRTSASRTPWSSRRSSELGLPGLLLIAAVLRRRRLWAAVRASRATRGPRDRARRCSCAALGVFAAWAVHTQVDWIHLLPGVTAAALIAAAVLLRPRRPDAAARLLPRRRRARSWPP